MTADELVEALWASVGYPMETRDDYSEWDPATGRTWVNHDALDAATAATEAQRCDQVAAWLRSGDHAGLVERLRAFARYEHLDTSVADEAADALEER